MCGASSRQMEEASHEEVVVVDPPVEDQPQLQQLEVQAEPARDLEGDGSVPPREEVTDQVVVWNTRGEQIPRMLIRYGLLDEIDVGRFQPNREAIENYRVGTRRMARQNILFSHAFQSCIPFICFYPGGEAALWHIEGMELSLVPLVLAQGGDQQPELIVVVKKRHTNQIKLRMLRECLTGIAPGVPVRWIALGFKHASTSVLVDAIRRDVYAWIEPRFDGDVVLAVKTGKSNIDWNPARDDVPEDEH